MQTIVVASQKGGSGKTTITRNLAVALGEDVALIDTDPQGSLTAWWNRREAEAPVLVGIDNGLPATLEALRAAGVKMVLIDTPPSAHAFVSDVIGLADLVVVPVRPTPDDLDAVGPTLDMIEAAGRNFVFVVSQAKKRTRLALETIPALAQHGKVSPTVIHDRVEFPTAALDGRAVVEVGDGPASTEIHELVAYLRKQLNKEISK
ncbi:ParA family protein (plasmid) [Skermanella rosea]|uniref:ParA family protein n=1 Tax=Skermanella rosea TaxID=1817965 RepID=UPI00193329AF|nr:ParA family protein [Skermanella rosea]UEM08201.1 ParA family protein [Skermanella rosea]